MGGWLISGIHMGEPSHMVLKGLPEIGLPAETAEFKLHAALAFHSIAVFLQIFLMAE